MGAGVGGAVDTVISNVLIKVNGFKEAATSEPENKLEDHSTENQMTQFSKCSSPAMYSSQDSPLDFSVKRRTSFSGSLTDDSHTSSSPGHSTDCSLRSPSSDPIPVDDIGSISRWRTPSSEDQISFEQAKALASPVPLPGFLGNFGLFPGTLINPVTHESEMNTFSQINGAVLNDKFPRKNGSLLKQYQNEALQMPLGFLGFGRPASATVENGINMSSLMGVNSKSILHMYQQQLELAKTAELSARFSKQSSVSSPSSSSSSVTSGNSPSPNLGLSSSPSVTFHARNSPVLTDTGLTSRTSLPANPRKRASSLPEDQKDEAYWERRRKNNDAAKRSRDARRAKEEEIAIRATFLEQENLKLREEVALLRTETHRLRHMLYSS
ncbi:unnamed protein product [Candidula unifasciata]|uniref:BZIP domain-containing protein n=1 Tax=Candidula unifasciata TaxID=100452 RepID=A0A8S3ZJ34_9EUPU|nr:unnamed protein product [Candidula unifasciata]